MNPPPYNFDLIGTAGYIAPRHLAAIRETDNRLVCALDKSDSAGILDRYFENVDFFTEFERFDCHVARLGHLNSDKKIHYVSICSPNYLHDAHIRFALRSDADAICEKPLVLNPWNCDALMDIEKETGRNVYNVLQLRIHPTILELRKQASRARDRRFAIDLTYITARGNWYFYSWKGDVTKSGGIATNIGIHFFVMLIWIFGQVEKSVLHYSNPKKMAGFLQLQNADVRWFLSLDRNDVPAQALASGKTTYRSIVIDGQEVEFSDGFTDLHTLVYRDILSGHGYGIEAARPSIELAYAIRHAPVSLHEGEHHPLLSTIIKDAVQK